MKVEALDYWYSLVGGNIIPVISREKRPKITGWKEWQNEPTPESTYRKWIADGLFENGVAIIMGKLWRGQYAGKYIACIDCDNQSGIDVFMTLCFPKLKTLDELSQITIVEQHKDNKEKSHI